MNYRITNTWAYRILSKKQVNFYHVLLEKVTGEEILDNLSYGSKVKIERDGSMTVTLSEEGRMQRTVAELKLFFQDVESDNTETPRAPYSFSQRNIDEVREWNFSILGSLALILLNDPILKKVMTGKWEFINSSICSLFVEPYTFVFTKEYVKIVHPVRPQNYEIREHAEHVAAASFSKIVKRLKEAYPGFEGMAIMSFTQEKTGFSAQYITKQITERSQTVTTVGLPI